MSRFGSEAPGRSGCAGGSAVRGRDAGLLPRDIELGPGAGTGMVEPGVRGRNVGSLLRDFELGVRCGLRRHRLGGWKGGVDAHSPLSTGAIWCEGADGPSPLSRGGCGCCVLDWKDRPLPFSVSVGRGTSNADLGGAGWHFVECPSLLLWQGGRGDSNAALA